jgi:hypothetical protein
MDAQRIGKCLTKLQDFYKQPLSPDLQEEFISFCIDNFKGIAQVEKAVSLVIQNEPNYGRIPAFKRMLELFREYMQTSTAAYKTPTLTALALPVTQQPEEISYHCLCCLDSSLLSTPTLQTYLKINNGKSPQAYACTRCDAHHKYPYSAVRHVSQNDCEQIHQAELERRRETDLQKTITRLKAKVKVAVYLKQPKFREQAIAEATQKGIALNLIGVAEKVAA